MPDLLGDQDARERIRDDLDETLFVEAGAGTGKTRELIERIVRLVSSGRTELRKIAAITFTEAAAAELRDRIRLRLEGESRPGGAQRGELTAEERARCAKALEQLDAAAIETLHGFAQRILAGHPLEAGLPPALEIRDGSQASIAFDERWAAFIDDLFADPALEETLLCAFVLGLEPDALRDVAQVLHDNWDRISPPDGQPAPPGDVDASGVIARLTHACAQKDACTEPSDKLLRHLLDIEPYVGRLTDAKTNLDTLRILAEGVSLTIGGGRQENWQGVAPTAIRDELKQAKERRDELLTSARADLLPGLLAPLTRFVLDYADERRRQGRLEFHDLLVRARNLLRESAEVRNRMKEQFTHLLIDEFQDTDPLQIEIAALLVGEETDGQPPHWTDAAIEAGRLFFVGDPKQSIYRFRRADIDLYQRAQRQFSPGEVRLSQNFRSVEPVIAWVNETFSQLMGTGATDGQATYVPLASSWPPLNGGGPSVHLLGGPADGNISPVRAKEADELAHAILTAKNEKWPVAAVTEDGERATRPARYADMAVLFPTRTSLPQIEDALERAGIPYRVESRSLVYDTQEVRDLLSILRAIDDPTDEVALVAALRSPAYGCGDDDLLHFYQSGGRWDYRRPAPESAGGDDPVAMAMESLHGLHQRRWWEPINVTVESVIRDRRLFELAFAQRRPRERWQRLRYLLDQSRSFAEAGGRTLRSFIDWAERQAGEGARVVETVVPEPDDDAVRLMTIHAAKGLEFPIVLLTGLNSAAGRSRRAPKPVLWDDDDAMQVAMGPASARFQSDGHEALATREQTMDEQEKIRLLYVAATRARDHLIVSLHHKLGTECHAARLYELTTAFPHLAQRRDWPQPAAAPASAAEPFDDSAERREAWLAKQAELLESYADVRSMSATGIAKAAAVAEAADPNLEKDAPLEETPPWRRGRAGTALGRAVHATLQSIDLATGADVTGAARAQAAAEGIAGRADEIERMVEAARTSGTIQQALQGRYWRETYVAAPVAKTRIEGFIDLLYESPDGLVVVDYKTDAVAGDDNVASAVARYRLQGAAYALALQETLDRPVVRCVFVFVSTGVAREREIDNLPAAIEEVRQVLVRQVP